MKETVQKLYDHFCEVSRGKIKTSNPVRNSLIIADAIKHKEDLEKKFPGITESVKNSN
jgi:hypothetical protein